MKKRKICVVVYSRANYGRIKSFMQAVKESKVLELWRLAGLDASNVASITDTSITVGGVTITIGQPDSNTTTLTRT